MTSPDLEDPQQFAAIIRVDWAAVEDWGRRRAELHSVTYGPWTQEQADDIAFEWVVLHPVMLACGRVAKRVNIPGLVSRDPKGGMRRCAGCCNATGIPAGIGSPKNDDQARAVLGLPD